MAAVSATATEAAAVRALAALNALSFTARRAIAASVHVGDEGIIFLPGAGTFLLSRHAEDRFTLEALNENEAAAYLLIWRDEKRQEVVN